MNFTLRTDLSDLDLPGEVTGLGGDDAVAALATPQANGDLSLLVLTLEGLERAKRAITRGAVARSAHRTS